VLPSLLSIGENIAVEEPLIWRRKGQKTRQESGSIQGKGGKSGRPH